MLGLGLKLGGGGSAHDLMLATIARYNVPAMLFDPACPGTLFEESTGITQSAYGDVVGLVLDRSEGLVGQELVPTVADREFTSDTGFWAKSDSTVTIPGDGLCHFTASNEQNIQVVGALTVGRWYRVTYDVKNHVSGAVAFHDGTTLYTTHTADGTYTELIKATANVLRIRAIGVLTADIDNISVRELKGNHLSQPTTAAKPIFRPGSYLDLDGVDDALYSTNPFSGDELTVTLAVRKRSVATTNSMIWGLGHETESLTYLGMFYDSAGGVLRLYCDGSFGSLSTSAPINETDVNIVTIRVDALSCSTRVNGVVGATWLFGTPLDLGAGNTFCLGALKRYIMTGNADIDLHSFFGISAALTTPEIEQIEQDISNRCGGPL